MQNLDPDAQDSAPLVVVCTAATELSLFLRHSLECEDIAAIFATSAREGFDQIVSQEPVMALIDCQLPEAPWLLRALSHVMPEESLTILALGAHHGADDPLGYENMGKVHSFPRPLDPASLIETIRRLARQIRVNDRNRLFFADIELDLTARKVWRRRREIRLTGIEFELLSALMREPGRVFSRESLIARAWPRGVFVEARTVNIHIGHLRRRLNAHGGTDLIRTVRGYGYALDRTDLDLERSTP
ncbi:MAG: response regulator transcription factor [Alphaproteobacteria bacterium]|nr:response regulator transcription factor [Alphaproteobacteria bacterium]